MVEKRQEVESTVVEIVYERIAAMDVGQKKVAITPRVPRHLRGSFTAGGFGTGNGLAGALVALVLGLIGMAIGGLALTRSRRTA